MNELVRLPPERRLSLYMSIARKMRKAGPYTKGVRHAAVIQAWEARQELREEMRVEVARILKEARGEA